MGPLISLARGIRAGCGHLLGGAHPKMRMGCISQYERWISIHRVLWECNGKNEVRRIQRVSMLQPTPVLTFTFTQKHF